MIEIITGVSSDPKDVFTCSLLFAHTPGNFSKNTERSPSFIPSFLAVITMCYTRRMSELSHLDESGHLHMVDVSGKPDTIREAVAQGDVYMQAETLALIREGVIKKGDVLTVAQIAGIQAAKRTADLIPLCHFLPLNQVDVQLELLDELPGVRITATARTCGKTGVEMEALTAVSIAALTVYDMAKAVEKTMHIDNVRLLEKRGGISGDVLNA